MKQNWLEESFEMEAKTIKKTAKPEPEKAPAAAGNATQADTGWRNQSKAAAAENATQADTGWRNQSKAAPAENATQADTGWRNQSKAAPAGNATQADTGWRNQSKAAPAGNATQADTGWRNQGKEEAAGNATQADTGWRAQSGSAQKASRTPVAAAGNPYAAVMLQADAAAFADMDKFVEAVKGLKELVSSEGKKYAVKKYVAKGGESAILLCADPEGKDVIAKVYFKGVRDTGSSVEARVRVLEYMRSEEGRKYTLAVSQIGLTELGGSKYYFEIMPHCPQGDLSNDKAYSFQQTCEMAAHLNEALHSMHAAGILHRDLKPANLYRLDGRVVIGDFGVAGIINSSDEGFGELLTKASVGTDGFRAPETVMAVTAGETAFIYTDKCDYYSLGATLASLYEGRFVYENMTAAMIAVCVKNGKLPLTKTDSDRELLENLLSGLCRYDSRYRFGYEDVRRWAKDHNYTGNIIEEEWPKFFRMLGSEYRDEKSLFEGVTSDATHWKEGLEMLYGKFFENFFKSFRTDLARAAQVADEQWRRKDRDKGLAVFLKSLYAPGAIAWKGYTFQSLKELGGKMAVTSTPEAYGELLQKNVVSHWLSNTQGIQPDRATLELVDAIEARSQKESAVACYWFGHSFAEKKALSVNGKTVGDMSQLLQALFSEPYRFYENKWYDKLMDRTAGAQLYGFLYSFGYAEVIDRQWANVAKMDLYNKAASMLAMLDMIAVKEKADASVLRSFFLNYGPLGIYTCARELACSGVYQGMDGDGKRILSGLTGFAVPESGTVEELLRACLPLEEQVTRLQGVLTDNPFLISTGVFEEKGVICTDLRGVFAFKLFGRSAPLGLEARIKNPEGGMKA